MIRGYSNTMERLPIPPKSPLQLPRKATYGIYYLHKVYLKSFDKYPALAELMEKIIK